MELKETGADSIEMDWNFLEDLIPIFNEEDIFSNAQAFFKDLSLSMPAVTTHECEWASNSFSITHDVEDRAATEDATSPLKSVVPRRARNKRRRPSPAPCGWSPANMNGACQVGADVEEERSCSHCWTKETPQWRRGPLGPNTLCNACGVRFRKGNGKLFPEYRPANSPTFDALLHSNSHTKVLQMRKR